jgi:hypothetical protein
MVGQDTHRRRFVVLLVGLVVATVTAVVPPAPALADAAGKGGDFVPLSPAGLLLDTRAGTGASGPIPAGGTVTFPVLGVGGVPSAGVSAVLVDVTAINPSSATFLTIWPDGQPRPGGSNLNLNANQALSNSAVVQVGTNGRIALYNRFGSTHAAVDVQGYFTSSSGGSGGGYIPLDHSPLVDTRSGLGTEKGTIPANGSRTITLTGGAIPADAAGAFLDLIVTGTNAAGWVGAYPVGGSGQRSTVDYVAGTTAVGVSVKLPATGQVVFANHGSSAIHLVLTAEGYFSASSSQGAGLRPLVPSRLGGMDLGPNATFDIQVGGRNGLPTRAIAAAALNLTVSNQTTSGWLRAWPVGGTEGATSLVNFASGIGPRAGMAVVKVGTEGKIRIKNVSSATVRVLVDLLGWFADPLPAVPVAQYSPVVARQQTPGGSASQGAIDYAYVNNVGGVLHGRQADPDEFGSIPFASLSELESFTGPPALGQLTDGRVQAVAQHTDSNFRSITQTAVNSPSWNAWALLGGSMASAPVAGRLSDGTTVLFAVDADGRLWAYAQAGTDQYWRSLGDVDLARTLSVAVASDGIRVVALDGGGAAKTAVYHADGSLTAWTDLGGTGLNGTPALVVYPGYRTRVFVRAADGTIVTKIQDPAGTFPAAWDTVGSFVAAGAPAAILDPSLARTAVVARGTDNMLNVVWETAQGSGQWGQWRSYQEPVASEPTVTAFANDSGQSWFALARNLNNQLIFLMRDEPQSPAGAAKAATDPTFTIRKLPLPPEAK